jgi:hypothetical protein
MDLPSNTVYTHTSSVGDVIFAGVWSLFTRKVAEQAGVASQHAACCFTAQEIGGEANTAVWNHSFET